MPSSVNKRGLVPKLRFPEFRDAEAWIAMKLNDACDVNPESSELPEEFAYIDLESVEAGELKARKIISSDEAPSRAQRLLRYGDVIFQIVRPYQRNNFHFRIDDDVHYVASTGYAQLRANESADFLFQAVHTDDFVERVIAKCTGSSYPAINSSDLADISIAIPRSDEQQKIADCLASLDARITLEAQKLDTLKTHKKGLMQQLFPAEGETLPKLRFPEFRDAGEWEEKLIEDFFDVGSSKRVLQQDWTTQGVPFYRTRELVSLSKNEPFGSEIFISEELFLEISEKYGLPAEGDFLVSGVGTLGISYQVQAQDRFYFKDGNVLWFKLRGGIVSTFFKYCFEADEIQNQILGQASISTVGTYTIQNAKVTKFSCPPNIEEQQKIADCLTSLDDLITAQTQKLAALKTHKKGLMQQLFPVLVEATA
jgi:type I restriction enzyme S subunit